MRRSTSRAANSWSGSPREHQTVSPVDQWQKRYYRGTDMTEQPVVPDHRTKLRLAPFAPVTPESLPVGRSERADHSADRHGEPGQGDR